MKFLSAKRNIWLIILFSLNLGIYAQSFSVLSWNISNMGKSKDDQELSAIARIVKDYDLIAIQEVVAKDPGGVQSVARLTDMLNRMGAQWDYVVSDPTNSPSAHMSERYAFLWKPSKLIRLSNPFLDTLLANQCVREPYIAKFRQNKGNKAFYVINFHSRRFDHKPEEEIQYFEDYPKRLDSDYIIIAGDFNLDEEHRVWKGLYEQGFTATLSKTPTTLKRACRRSGKGGYFNHSIDNIYFQSKAFIRQDGGRLDFVNDCDRLEEARMISDHVPVYLMIQIQ